MTAASAVAWWASVASEVSPESVLTEFEPLAPKTTFRLGGPARWYAEPASVEDLRRLWLAAQAADVPVFFLGRGSNLIVIDAGFDGLVMRLNHPRWKEVRVEGASVVAAAGARLKQVCGAAAKAGLAGFEFLEGIPGSVGGALRMNAGAMGGWIFDVVVSVDWMTPDGAVHTTEREAFQTGYRHCAELDGAVALGARLRPAGAASLDAIRAQLDSYASVRKSSQPREPSAGCIFKNPTGGHAGKWIDEAGLKGTAVGGAAVSTVHGNFIINPDGATCADVIDLIRSIRERVRAERGVWLEPEALLLGARWEDVL